MFAIEHTHTHYIWNNKYTLSQTTNNNNHLVILPQTYISLTSIITQKLITILIIIIIMVTTCTRHPLSHIHMVTKVTDHVIHTLRPEWEGVGHWSTLSNTEPATC